MLDYQDTSNVDSKGIAFTIRSVFVIDPKKTIRLTLSYPASTGRNVAELLRVIDSLQTGDKNRYVLFIYIFHYSPAQWRKSHLYFFIHSF